MNELSKNLVCVCMRNQVEIWVEADRAETLTNLLTSQNAPQFIKYEGRLINRADLVGVFSALDMEDVTRRKNGEWKCKMNEWHERKQECSCRSKIPELIPEPDVSDEQRTKNLEALNKLKAQYGNLH